MAALKIDKRGKLVVPESSIEATCTQLLELDGWRAFKMEQNFSERKVKVVGEKGMPDRMYMRYRLCPWLVDECDLDSYGILVAQSASFSEVLWIEWKSAKGKPSAHQRAWHEAERKRGALTLIAGIDFPAFIEGFKEFYRGSGLNRGKV